MIENCPKCGKYGFEIFEDEVDIGVGIQTFIQGGLCSECGPIEHCNFCGNWDGKHSSWCIHSKEDKEV